MDARLVGFGVVPIDYQGTLYVGISTKDNLYALTVEQARAMALALLDVIDEVEKS